MVVVVVLLLLSQPIPWIFERRPAGDDGYSQAMGMIAQPYIGTDICTGIEIQCGECILLHFLGSPMLSPVVLGSRPVVSSLLCVDLMLDVFRDAANLHPRLMNVY